MAPRVHLETERLRLRDWTAADAEPFAMLNSDARVMEFFPRSLDYAESEAILARNQADIDTNGYGLYAVEQKENGRFIGFVGLMEPAFEAHFMPATEIGWRLARESWGEGFATEGARAVVDHAFGPLGFDALVSFTAEWNRPSRRVMEKLGMTHDPAEDFIHPRLPPGHKLARHVLYRLSRRDWLARKQQGGRKAAPSRRPDAPPTD